MKGISNSEHTIITHKQTGLFADPLLDSPPLKKADLTKLSEILINSRAQQGSL